MQAFRVKSRMWGMQFHPEPTEEMIASWIASFGPVMQRQGVNLEDLAALARRDVPVWSRFGAGTRTVSSRWSKRFGSSL